MINYKFITINELIDYIWEHKDCKVDFTGDTKDGVKVGGPEGWYGVRIDTSFDGLDLVIGYYGSGIMQHWNLFEMSEDNAKSPYECAKIAFKEWFKDWMLHDSPICVDADDMKGDAL